MNIAKNRKANVILAVTVQLAILFAAVSFASAQSSLQNGDGYVRRQANEWVMGTSRMEETVRLESGRFVLLSLRNKISGTDYADEKNPADQIRFTADGKDVGASGRPWKLLEDHLARGSQGELQLDIELESEGLRVTEHYVVYPGTSLIREWLTLRNASAKPIQVSHLDFLHCEISGSAAENTLLNYLTGGGNYNGSQLLKSELVSAGYDKVFDSNGGIQPGNYSSFLPLIFLRDRKPDEGVAIGWDYLGHWRFQVSRPANGPFHLQLEVAGFKKDLPPGGRIETPKAFVDLFSGGADDLGNQLLDWQYEYFWNYTNPEYFAKTRWAVDWPDPWVGDGGTPSADNWGRRLALDLRYVDLLRETGTDILWDDAGWYDKWGTWNGPDWRRTNDYLRKYGMRWVLWFPTFLATPESRVAQQHPGWLIPGQDAFEQSIPATADWQDRLLNQSVRNWGNYEWRYDIAPAASATDTGALAADQNFRQLLERFKKDHPQSGIDACDGGGRWISYDIARLADSGEYTDGGVGPYSAYYTSLIVPPDKLHNVVDYDHTYYSPSDLAHLAMDPTWYRDPGDGPDVEAIRKEWELYHYLVAQGVAGRWSHIFRPHVENDDPIWYLQRMNRDGSKGVILVKHEKLGATYFVVSHPAMNPDGQPDQYLGGPGQMNAVTTTSAASLQTGIYEDPVDGAFRYYGVPGEEFGPVNLKYQAEGRDRSLITKVVKLGVERKVTGHFFGMALQVEQPMTVTELGQLDPENNHGTYVLSLVRAADGKVLAAANLDMGQGYPDANGFKYAHLPQPVPLDSVFKPVVIYPRGLAPAETYEVRTRLSGLHLRETGARLMSEGITLNKIAAGELIFLNLPHYPGSGADHIPPTAPTQVKKRLGTNLGVQGVELSWSPSQDNNWISYYEVRKEGQRIGRVAKGTFFFDHSETARDDLDKKFEVRAVDGDGNVSALVTAQAAGSEPQIYEALGGFSPAQTAGQWMYEEQLDNGSYRNLTWDKGGYEGRWAGSGLGRIGRIWMQPSAQYDLSRTFLVPSAGIIHTAGTIRKDPSAENQHSSFVRILLNSRQIWPAEGWAEVRPDYDLPTTYQVQGIRVVRGDKLRFIVQHNGQNRPDPIVWDPRITLEGTGASRQSEAR